MSVYVRNGKFYVDFYDGNRQRVRRLLRGCPDRETAERAQKALEAEAFKLRLQDSLHYSSQVTQYPSIPQPTIHASNAKTSLPEGPGVYFFWDNRTLVYVGSAVNLRRRVGRGHKQWSPDYKLSFLEMDKALAAGAEAYYIGLLRPSLNSESRPLVEGRAYRKYRPRVKKDAA